MPEKLCQASNVFATNFRLSRLSQPRRNLNQLMGITLQKQFCPGFF
jgi:hypothetical protein